MNSMAYESTYRSISYQASNWFCDLLPLDSSVLTTREFLKINMRDIQVAMGCTEAIDFAFAVNRNVLAAVCLKERKVATYRYQEGCGLCGLYTSKAGGPWLDVAAFVKATPWGRLEAALSLTGSLFVLTKENTVIKISVQPPDYSLIEEYSVVFDQKTKYKNILLGSKPSVQMNQRNLPDDAIHLWAPDKKILQNYHLYRNGTGELKREVRIKRPKRTETEEISEIPYDPQALTMCMDEMEDSVICADRTNHLLFECSLKTSHSEVLCGQGTPGCPEENMKTPLASLNAPCAPLALRPGEFISMDHFRPFSRNIITAEKAKKKPYGKKPRIILVCDAGNHAVRKIWQFPSSPQAGDLAKLNRIYTMLSESKIAGRTGDLLDLHCGEPKNLFIGPSGRLTVTTDSTVYVFAPHFSVLEDNLSSKSLFIS